MTQPFRAYSKVEPVFLAPSMRGAAQTDVGLRRQYNEDRVGVFPELGLALVADGMGGSSSGDIAAEWVLDTVTECWAQQREASWSEETMRGGYPLRIALELANLRILDGASSDLRFTGIGAAAVALAEVPGGVLLAHVGDCRIYRLRGGVLELMTRDHSLINEYYDHFPEGLDQEQIDRLPRNVITRALGMKPGCSPELRFEPLLPGDRYLLCSDGLHGMVEDLKIEAICAGESDFTRACARLVEAANEAGGEDNIAVALVGW
jgi:serine/threonine protein phosphatase PrpC